MVEHKWNIRNINSEEEKEVSGGSGIREEWSICSLNNKHVKLFLNKYININGAQQKLGDTLAVGFTNDIQGQKI